jgi:acetyl esterase/lipase
MKLLRLGILPWIAGAALGAPSYLATPGHWIELWPEGVAGRRPGGPAEVIVADGRLAHVRTPKLRAFLPPAGTACGTAVVFCPGGGYIRLPAQEAEGDFERWLNHLGLAVFDLTYRFGDDGPDAPLRDVLRAIRLVRAHADEYGVKADRIGVMGASAGGHVAALASCYFDDPAGRTGAALDAVRARPDFAVMLYPVITMQGPYVHKGSRGGLLGPNPSLEAIQRYSMELHVTKDTCPTWLISTQADQSVPMENSLFYYAALRRAGVPAELHLFEKGPHGFRFTDGLGPTSDWPARCEDWLRFHGWLPAGP